jgi:hypothetical protein
MAATCVLLTLVAMTLVPSKRPRTQSSLRTLDSKTRGGWSSRLSIAAHLGLPSLAHPSRTFLHSLVRVFHFLVCDTKSLLSGDVDRILTNYCVANKSVFERGSSCRHSTPRINPQSFIPYLDQSFFWAARNIIANYEMYTPCSSWFSTWFEFYVGLGS